MIRSANQVTGFYMNCRTRLKWVNDIFYQIIIMPVNADICNLMSYRFIIEIWILAINYFWKLFSAYEIVLPMHQSIFIETTA